MYRPQSLVINPGRNNLERIGEASEEDSRRNKNMLQAAVSVSLPTKSLLPMQGLPRMSRLGLKKPILSHRSKNLQIISQNSSVTEQDEVLMRINQNSHYIQREKTLNQSRYYQKEQVGNSIDSDSSSSGHNDKFNSAEIDESFALSSQDFSCKERQEENSSKLGICVENLNHVDSQQSSSSESNKVAERIDSRYQSENKEWH